MMPGMSVGILAFGSMAEEPGPELAATATRRIAVQTPFFVEFARSSRTRDGAPTLVPVRAGGARVPATILVLDDSVTVADARAILYRRETGRLNDISAVPRPAGSPRWQTSREQAPAYTQLSSQTSGRSPRRSWPNSRYAARPRRPAPNGAMASLICSSKSAAGS